MGEVTTSPLVFKADKKIRLGESEKFKNKASP